MRHVTRHVERPLYAREWHECGRCGARLESHGAYVLHDCAWQRTLADDWARIGAAPTCFAGNPVEPVVYDDELEFAQAMRTLQGQADHLSRPIDMIQEMMGSLLPTNIRVSDLVAMGGDGYVRPAGPGDTPIGVVVASDPHDCTVGVMRFGGMQPRRMGRP